MQKGKKWYPLNIDLARENVLNKGKHEGAHTDVKAAGNLPWLGKRADSLRGVVSRLHVRTSVSPHLKTFPFTQELASQHFLFIDHVQANQNLVA